MMMIDFISQDDSSGGTKLKKNITTIKQTLLVN